MLIMHEERAKMIKKSRSAKKLIKKVESVVVERQTADIENR